MASQAYIKRHNGYVRHQTKSPIYVYEYLLRLSHLSHPHFNDFK